MSRFFVASSRRATTASGRAGLSLVEFLGCSIAVVAGVWIGATYFGVEVNRLAYTALDETELLDKVPADWRPPPPKGSDASLSRDQLAELLHDELGALRSEVVALRESRAMQRESTDRTTDSDHPADSTAPRRKETLSYWNHLRDIARDEAELQQRAQSALAEGQTDRVLALKARICRFAGKAVKAIPAEHVDPQALKLGLQLQEWYERGGDLYDQAAEIWSNPAVQQSSAHVSKKWDVSQRQRTNEAELLNHKASAVRASLIRRFGGDFGEFGG